jgi:hypothetical protein
MAWIPMYSVKAAETKQNTMATDNNPPGQANFVLTQGSKRLIRDRPMVSMDTVKMSVIKTVSPSEIDPLDSPIMLNMMENMIHPKMSMIMADAIMTMPIFVLKMCRSISTRAMTGSAVMESVVPMKSAKTSLSSVSPRLKREGAK